MHRPSPRFVFAFQIALALVITYGLTLWFDWDRPRWAAFAVIAMATQEVSMSLARGGQRLLGTVIGSSVALLIIALFPQDRWLYVGALSLWMGVCIYMMGFSQRSYLWQCAGFVCGIIAATAANVGGNSFMLAIDRTLETGLGILVYTLVTLLVWRNTGESDTEAAAVPDLYFADMDQLMAAARMIFIYMSSFLAIVYIPAFPAGISFLAPLAGIAMGVLSMPQVPTRALHVPVALALTIASVIYMFVMPPLAGFAALAILIFLVGFSVSYKFYGSPQANIVRLLVLMVFAALTGINNDQVYVFSAVSNNVLVFFMVIVLLHVTSRFPFSMRPETRFINLVERFQVSASYLAASGAADGWLARRKLGFHKHEVANIPRKLASWRPFLPPDIAASSADELDALMKLMTDSQALLLESAGGSTERAETVSALASSCAMIDAPAWRQPRF